MLTLTRPFVAQVTSIYAYPNIRGFSYIMAVVQHPYGESECMAGRSEG